MNLPYETYFVDKKNRIECMLLCALKKHINWYESGLRIVSWNYKKTHSGNAENLNQAFNNHTRFEIDKRRKVQLRPIGIGDVIVFDGTPYIIGVFGFIQIPIILWNRIMVK